MTLKLCYIAGKFRGDTPYDVFQNICVAERRGLDAAYHGVYPVIPHTMTQHFDKLLTDDFWLQGTLEMLRRCDAVLTVDNWMESVGAQAEVMEAQRLRMPVFHSLRALDDWLQETK